MAYCPSGDALMKKPIVMIVLLTAVAVACWYGWQHWRPHGQDAGVFYGNIDVRQVSLAFEGSGRVAQVDAEEGDRVQPGQVLAILDTRTLALQADQAAAQLRAQEENLRRLKNGARPAEIAQAFVDGVRHWFSADLRRVGADEAQDVLDTWVDQNTAGLIKSSALQADQIELAMQNVVLFAAQWEKLFDEDATAEADFTRADGKVVRVQTMRQTSAMVCTEGSTGAVTWKVLRVPYSEDFALDIVLPQQGTLPEALPAGTWAAASTLLDEAQDEGILPEVNLTLPRIDLSTPAGGVDILPVLDSLGVDIRPMGRINPEFETTVYRQQVRLIVREDGTVAAAVSEHGGMATAPNPGPTTDFHVDHPYVLRLRDLSTGLALFEAVINDPS